MGLGLQICIGDIKIGDYLGFGLRIGDWGFGIGIVDWDLDWDRNFGFGFEDLDRELGSEIGIRDWNLEERLGLEIGIIIGEWNCRLRFGIKGFELGVGVEDRVLGLEIETFTFFYFLFFTVYFFKPSACSALVFWVLIQCILSSHFGGQTFPDVCQSHL